MSISFVNSVEHYYELLWHAIGWLIEALQLVIKPLIIQYATDLHRKCYHFRFSSLFLLASQQKSLKCASLAAASCYTGGAGGSVLKQYPLIQWLTWKWAPVSWTLNRPLNVTWPILRCPGVYFSRCYWPARALLPSELLLSFQLTAPKSSWPFFFSYKLGLPWHYF